MSEVRVTYKTSSNNTGFITINGIEIPTDTFLTIDNTLQQNIKINSSDQEFVVFQKKLRFLDCVKDAMVGVNVSNSVKILYNNIDYEEPFKVLGEWEDKFMKQNEQIIKKYSWTKKTKDSTLEPILDARVVFKESGLNPEYFISPEIRYVGNIATEIIDPAGRSPIENKDIKFPENNTKLVLEKSFMELFGFENCYMESTRISNSKYTYKIIIGPSSNMIGGEGNKTTRKINTVKTEKKKTRTTQKTKITKTYRTQEYNPNNIIIDDEITVFDKNIGRVNWFQGNKEKNKYIRDTTNPITTQIKRSLFISKELGDVLQVLLMFIWSKLNPLESYCITTCDKVVCLLCMSLQINCILTYGEKATEKKSKMRSIDLFEPSSNTSNKAFARFESTKNGIVKHNNAFINCLNILKREKIKVYASGITEPFEISVQIYDKIINDLIKINNLLMTQTIDPDTNPSNIDDFTKVIKINFTFIEFIRISKQNKVTITMQSIYTSNNRLWIDVINPSFSKYRYGKDSFYKLIKNPGLLLITPIKENSSQMQVDSIIEELPAPLQVQPPTISRLNPMELNDALAIRFSEPINMSIYSAAGGSNKRKNTSFSNNSTFLKSISYLEYPDIALFYDKDNNETYNLYDELNEQINHYLTTIRKIEFYDHVYTNLLHYFYLTGKVLYDNELKAIIYKMFTNERNTPVRRRLKVKTKINKTAKLSKNPSQTKIIINKDFVSPPRKKTKVNIDNISPLQKSSLVNPNIVITQSKREFNNGNDLENHRTLYER